MIKMINKIVPCEYCGCDAMIYDYRENENCGYDSYFCTNYFCSHFTIKMRFIKASVK